MTIEIRSNMDLLLIAPSNRKSVRDARAKNTNYFYTPTDEPVSKDTPPALPIAKKIKDVPATRRTGCSSCGKRNRTK